MEDTKNYISKQYDILISRKSGAERILMGFSMFSFSSRFLLSSLDKNLTPEDIRKQVFLRLYGNEVDKNTQDDVLNYLQSAGSPNNPPGVYY